MKIRHDANRPKKNGKMAALHRQKWEKPENSIQHVQNLEILQLNEMYIGMDSYLYQMESETTLTPRARKNDTNITQLKQRNCFLVDLVPGFLCENGFWIINDGFHHQDSSKISAKEAIQNSPIDLRHPNRNQENDIERVSLRFHGVASSRFLQKDTSFPGKWISTTILSAFCPPVLQ